MPLPFVPVLVQPASEDDQLAAAIAQSMMDDDAAIAAAVAADESAAAASSSSAAAAPSAAPSFSSSASWIAAEEAADDADSVAQIDASSIAEAEEDATNTWSDDDETGGAEVQKALYASAKSASSSSAGAGASKSAPRKKELVCGKSICERESHPARALLERCAHPLCVSRWLAVCVQDCPYCGQENDTDAQLEQHMSMCEAVED